MVQSFENAKYLRSVARPFEGLTADYQLLIEVRSFQILTSVDPVAAVEFTAKIMVNDGRIIDARIFRATVPAKGTDAPTAAAALDAAFGKAATELVLWTSSVV